MIRATKTKDVAYLKNLRKSIEVFFYKNRDRGIKNLMLYIAIGNLIVFFLSMIDPSNLLYGYLYFDRALILRGQVWRLVSYVFTYLNDFNAVGMLLNFIMLFCYYQIGRMLEQYWGVARFNAYYFCGILFMDIGALLLGQNAAIYYLNLTLFLAVATILPDIRFLLFFIIPVKAKYLAWVYLGMTLWNLIKGLITMFTSLGSGSVYLGWLFPVIALANYFLFFGSSLRNLLPESMRYRKVKSDSPKASAPGPNWASNYRSKSGEKPYRHKCTVCGRTDVQYPNLEFRYCSRCAGYHCYCIDHINNHVHITE